MKLQNKLRREQIPHQEFSKLSITSSSLSKTSSIHSSLHLRNHMKTAVAMIIVLGVAICFAWPSSMETKLLRNAIYSLIARQLLLRHGIERFDSQMPSFTWKKQWWKSPFGNANPHYHKTCCTIVSNFLFMHFRVNFFPVYNEYSLKCNKWLLSASKWYQQQTQSHIYCHWNDRNHPMKHD